MPNSRDSSLAKKLDDPVTPSEQTASAKCHRTHVPSVSTNHSRAHCCLLTRLRVGGANSLEQAKRNRNQPVGYRLRRARLRRSSYDNSALLQASQHKRKGLEQGAAFCALPCHRVASAVRDLDTRQDGARRPSKRDVYGADTRPSSARQ